MGLSSNLLRCICSVFSGTLSFVYPIQIVVVSDDTTTVCPHLFVFYLPSTECSHPLSSTTDRLCLLFTLSSLASNGRTVERWLFRKVRETILVDSIRVATNN